MSTGDLPAALFVMGQVAYTKSTGMSCVEILECWLLLNEVNLMSNVQVLSMEII